MSKVYSMPPDAGMMLNSMRALGYSFQTALADVIDNCIGADATEVRINSSVDPRAEQFLLVCDNGYGMSEDELRAAMRHACKNPGAARATGDLGRFGLGMKTASLSQCRCLRVISKKNSCLSGAAWDLDYIGDNSEWSLLMYDAQELTGIPGHEYLDSVEHGTVVIWTKFDRLASTERNVYDGLIAKLDDAVEHLSLIYHRYLSGDGGPKLKMFVNGRALKPKDPFLSADSAGSARMPTEVIPIENGEVLVTPYYLPHQNKLAETQKAKMGISGRTLTDDQGFYIYRNRRLIYWGGWLRMAKRAQLTKLSRVCVDVPNSLDHLWELDIKKSTAVPPKLVRDSLKAILDSMSAPSRKNLTKGVRVGKSAERAALWDTNIGSDNRYSVSINKENPLYQVLTAELPAQQKKQLNAYLSLLEFCYPARWVADRVYRDQASTVAEERRREFIDAVKKRLDVFIQVNAGEIDRDLFLRLLKNEAVFASDMTLSERILDELISDIKQRQ